MKENNLKNAIELSPEDLENISGGLIVEDADGKFWLVRQNGTIISPVPGNKAAEFADAYGISKDVITSDDYKLKFGRDLAW
jgi:hypothetical protein